MHYAAALSASKYAGINIVFAVVRPCQESSVVGFVRLLAYETNNCVAAVHTSVPLRHLRIQTNKCTILTISGSSASSQQCTRL